MRIFIDATTICDKDGRVGAGIEHYTWSIVFSLLRLNSSHIFFLMIPKELNSVRVAVLVKGVSNVRIMRAPFRIPFVSRHIIEPIRIFLTRCDVGFFPGGQMPLGLFFGKNVVTIHDVMIYTHSKWFDEEQRRAFSTRITVPLSIERASALVCVSRATQDALHSLFPVTKERTSVIYEGVETPYLDSALMPVERFPFERDYVFFIGTNEPRKNLANAFAAFDLFLQGHSDQHSSVRFIVAGARGWNTEKSDALMREINSRYKDVEPGGVIQCLGPVTEEEKWNLLRRASCLFFPSFMEGFGLPVLEAMSVGTPVITTTRGALKEVGGDAPIYVEPEDLSAMSLALAQCLLVPEGVVNLREEGYKRAENFSWDNTAQKTLEVIQSV